MRNPVLVIFSAQEEAALHELPLMAQVMYLRGLRPYMDAASGLVGIRRRVSERGLAEVVTVPARAGRQSEHVVEPTRKQVRAALDALEAAGLLRRVQGVDRCFVFCLPLAMQGKSVLRRKGQMKGQGFDMGEPHWNAGFSTDGDGSRGQMKGPHQSYISTITTEASFKVTNARESEVAAVSLPIGTDIELWEMFCGHQRTRRQWSIYKARLWAKHLRDIAEDGGDPSAVLDWALTRGLSDLRDAHRRMQGDAKREAMADRRDGESLANRAVRQVRERMGHGFRVIDGGAAIEGGSND